jgi:hypothetical protein
VTEKKLNPAQIGAGLQQVNGIGVPQGAKPPNDPVRDWGSYVALFIIGSHHPPRTACSVRVARDTSNGA